MYCAVNDRLDSYIEAKDSANWTKVVDGKEIQVVDNSVYVFETEGGDIRLAPEYQIDSKLDDRLYFKVIN